MYIELYRPVEEVGEEGDEVEANEEEEDSRKEHDIEHETDQADCDFCNNNFWEEARNEEEFSTVDDLLDSLM